MGVRRKALWKNQERVRGGIQNLGLQKERRPRPLKFQTSRGESGAEPSPPHSNRIARSPLARPWKSEPKEQGARLCSSHSSGHRNLPFPRTAKKSGKRRQPTVTVNRDLPLRECVKGHLSDTRIVESFLGRPPRDAAPGFPDPLSPQLVRVWKLSAKLRSE